MLATTESNLNQKEIQEIRQWINIYIFLVWTFPPLTEFRIGNIR